MVKVIGFVTNILVLSLQLVLYQIYYQNITRQLVDVLTSIFTEYASNEEKVGVDCYKVIN